MNPSQLVGWASGLHWRTQTGIVPSGVVNIRRHIDLIAPVIRHLTETTGRPVAVCHGIALTPAFASAEYSAVFDALADNAELENCPPRIPVIATIAANAAWHLDPTLSVFPNPWGPIMQLYELGYPTSYQDTPKHDGVALRVGLRNGTQLFQVYGVTVVDEHA